jgi:hypothetical protein
MIVLVPFAGKSFSREAGIRNFVVFLAGHDRPPEEGFSDGKPERILNPELPGQNRIVLESSWFRRGD